MTDRGSARHFDLSDDGLRLTLAGAWRLAELPALAPELAGARPRAPLTVDGEKLASLDSAAALQLVRTLAAAGVDPAAIRWQGFSAPHRRVLDGVLRRGTALAEAVPTARRGWLASIGVHATIILREGVEQPLARRTGGSGVRLGRRRAVHDPQAQGRADD